MSVEFDANLPDFGDTLTRLNPKSSPKEVAEEFESLFIGYTLKVMRETSGSSGFFGSGEPGSDIYLELMEQEVARAMAKSGGFGLAGQLTNALTDGSRSESAPETPPVHLPDSESPVAIEDQPISSGMGWRKDPFTHDWKYHKGVDLAAPSGTPVPAMMAGRVEFSGWQLGYGNTVVVENQDGLRMRYAHLNQLEVSTGEEVRRKQIIGEVGSTGRSTGPHLHLEMELNGRLENPVLALEQYRKCENAKVSNGTVDMDVDQEIEGDSSRLDSL